MAQATEITNLRRESRYGIAKGKQLLARVSVLGDDGEFVDHQGAILDLSRSGCKIELDCCVPGPVDVLISFASEGVMDSVSIRGNVCWSRPTEKDRWWIGCSFDEPLSFQLLAQLALIGYIDRRNDPRVPYALPIQCRRQLNDEVLNGTLINVSVGGFAVALDRGLQLEADERLLVSLDAAAVPEVSVVGRVRWNRQEETHSVIGCSFIARDAFPLLKEQLALVDAQQRTGTSRPSTRTLLGLLAAVATAAAGAAVLLYGP